MQRYTLRGLPYKDDYHEPEEIENDSGGWVKYEDVIFEKYQHNITGDEDVEILAIMAQRYDTSHKTFALLSKNEDVEIRCLIARNPAVPDIIRDSMFADECDSVRTYVANWTKSELIIEFLLNDTSQQVRNTAKNRLKYLQKNRE